jgi:hypothetical protein
MRPVAVSCAIAAIGLLGACSPIAHTSLPDGVSIDVYQTRMDYGARELEVSVTNATDAELEILELVFDSPAFVSETAYARAPSTVGPGRTTDFRVSLPAADCSATDPKPVVRIEFEHDGMPGSASVEPVDRLGQLPGITAEDCLAEALAEHVTVEWSEELRIVDRGGRKVALLDLVLEPTGAPGEVTLETLHGTPLFLLTDENGEATDGLALATAVRAQSDRTTVTIGMVPTRCDPHALADDKRGTWFPLHVSTDRLDGTVYVPTSERMRAELFAYIELSCAA